MPADPEAAPLRGGDLRGSQEEARRPSCSWRGVSPTLPARRMSSARRAAAACLALAVASSGAALWVQIGRAVEGLIRPGLAVAPARAAAAAAHLGVVGPSEAAAGAHPPPPPSPAVAAAEWAVSMLAAYPDSPALDAARAALAAQDATEAAAAGARFAAIDAAPAGPPVPYTGDPADYALSPALLASLLPQQQQQRTGGQEAGGHAAAPYITITWCNAAFVPFALNWAAHARGAGMGPFLVGASDEAALRALLAAGLPTFAMPRLVGKRAGLPQTSPADLGWGSPAFHKLGREKAATAAAVTGSGHDVLLTDVDLVFLADPAPYFARFPDAALLTSSDGLHRTTAPNPAVPAAVASSTLPANATGLAAAAAAVALPSTGTGLEAWPAALDAAGNIGIMLWRAVAHPVAVAWRDALVAEPAAWDQDVFNDLLRAGAAPATGNATATLPPPPTPGLFRTFGLAAPTSAASLAGVLPVDTFASGHTHFVQRLSERTGHTPYAVHTTFQFSGTAGKRHRLRERWLWSVDGEDRYAPAGGLLTLGALEDHPAVAALLARAAPGVVGAGGGGGGAHPLAALAGHFALVNAQLAILRAGLALATSLNRTLVLPRLWCGADRWWNPHGGVVPGTALPARLPFRCPADHILDLAAMEGDGRLGLDEYGPPIPFREAGLTANPRFPEASRAAGPDGTLEVVVGGGGGGDTRSTVSLPSALEAGALRAALDPYAATPVLHFPDPAAAWAGFGDAPTAARFARRIAASTDLWCCVPGVEVGHVWYDAQTDVDHVDRHGRAWRAGEWATSVGP